MTSFEQAWAVVTAELTPRPWDFTDPAGTILTVVPEGLVQDRGHGGVVLRITEDHHRAAEVTVTTAEVPVLIRALTGGHRPSWHDFILATLDVFPQADGSLRLTVDEYDGTTARITLPCPVRRHLAAALDRAADVARGWER